MDTVARKYLETKAESTTARLFPISGGRYMLTLGSVSMAITGAYGDELLACGGALAGDSAENGGACDVVASIDHAGVKKLQSAK